MLTIAVIGAALLLMTRKPSSVAPPDIGLGSDVGSNLGGGTGSGSAKAPPPNISGAVSGIAGALSAFLASTGIGAPLAAVVTAVGAAMSWFADEAWRSQYAAETYRQAYNELLREGERQGIRHEVAAKLDSMMLALYVDIMKRPVGWLQSTNSHLVHHLNMATDGLLGDPVTRAGAPKGAWQIKSYLDGKTRVYAPNGVELDMISNEEADRIDNELLAKTEAERYGDAYLDALIEARNNPDAEPVARGEIPTRKIATAVRTDIKTGTGRFGAPTGDRLP